MADHTFAFAEDQLKYAMNTTLKNHFRTDNSSYHVVDYDTIMRDPAIPQAPRDASAAAIVASALYELAGYVAGEEKAQCLNQANTILDNLAAHYQAQPETEKGFLLLHSTGHYPGGDEIDVPIVYADYYYLEAVLRRAKMK